MRSDHGIMTAAFSSLKDSCIQRLWDVFAGCRDIADKAIFVFTIAAYPFRKNGLEGKKKGEPETCLLSIR